MAALVVSVRLPLLLDTLLASSWTWLALSLATIATLLRAFSRIFLSRRRPQAALLPPPSSIVALEAEQAASFNSEFSLQSTQECRRPASENLVLKPGGLECRERFFSCMRDCHFAPSIICDAAFAPIIFDGQPPSVSGESFEVALRSFPHAIDCELVSRVGFLVDTPEEGLEAPWHGLIKNDANPHHMWTSDVISRYKTLHNSPFDIPYSSLKEPLCFEVQFGWHKVLETKLGAPWHTHLTGLTPALMRVMEPSIYDKECVVKGWSAHQRNLLKALMIEESSVAALDVNVKGGLVCTACKSGKVSQWDIGKQACLTRVCSIGKPMSALSLNAEKGVVITGNGEILGLWDYKCPRVIPIFDGSDRPVKMYPCAGLRCEGNMLYIDQANGIFSCRDLRKPQGSRLSIGTHPDSLPAVLTMEEEEEEEEEEESFVLWEKLACDEEDVWDEYSSGHGDVQQKSSSFTSKCATLVRSLSTSGR